MGNNAQQCVTELLAKTAGMTADEFMAICRDELERGSLTSMPLKLEFMRRRGFASVDEVHDWMQTTRQRFADAVTRACILPAAQPEKQAGQVWQSIETAPKDNKRLLFLARLDANGKLAELDFDGSWEYWEESWELSHINGYCWMSANGIEEPTHWAYQDDAPPAPIQQAGEVPEAIELLRAFVRHYKQGGRPYYRETIRRAESYLASMPTAAPAAQDDERSACIEAARKRSIDVPLAAGDEFPSSHGYAFWLGWQDRAALARQHGAADSIINGSQATGTIWDGPEAPDFSKPRERIQRVIDPNEIWLSWSDAHGYGYWDTYAEAELNSAHDFKPVRFVPQQGEVNPVNWKDLIHDLNRMGWTQTRIAKEVGCSQAAIARLKNNPAQQPVYMVGRRLILLHVRARHAELTGNS